MNKLKKGFSLAEILIAVGIVSVIATFGFSIAKRGIENAYKTYIYTGYMGIYSALSDARENGYSYDSGNITNTQNWLNYLASILDGTADTELLTIKNIPNGIEYVISDMGNSVEDGRVIYIKMQLPARKTNGNQNETVCLAYFPEGKYNLLLPFNTHANSCTSTIDVRNRPDLLLFYIDNGLVGRRYPNNSGNFTFTPRTYLSAQDAVCRFVRSKNNGSQKFYIYSTTTNNVLYECPANTPSSSGVLKVENPRKLKAF